MYGVYFYFYVIVIYNLKKMKLCVSTWPHTKNACTFDTNRGIQYAKWSRVEGRGHGERKHHGREDAREERVDIVRERSPADGGGAP